MSLNNPKRTNNITAIKVHTVIVVLFTVKALFISFTSSPFFIYKTLGKLLV
jgi:hypothetical protein